MKINNIYSNLFCWHKWGLVVQKHQGDVLIMLQNYSSVNMEIPRDDHVCIFDTERSAYLILQVADQLIKRIARLAREEL